MDKLNTKFERSNVLKMRFCYKNCVVRECSSALQFNDHIGNFSPAVAFISDTRIN